MAGRQYAGRCRGTGVTGAFCRLFTRCNARPFTCPKATHNEKKKKKKQIPAANTMRPTKCKNTHMKERTKQQTHRPTKKNPHVEWTVLRNQPRQQLRLQAQGASSGVNAYSLPDFSLASKASRICSSAHSLKAVGYGSSLDLSCLGHGPYFLRFCSARRRDRFSDLFCGGFGAGQMP
jgi:hypothetical protein